MAHKDTPQLRAAFLRALGGCGNLTLAAQKCGVTRGWAEGQRGRDVAFDAACRKALARFFATIRDPDSSKAPKGWRSIDGVELVVRGGPGGRPQIRRAPIGGWSPSVERRFLSVLAATCNVKAACEAVGLTQTAAYHHRRQWTAFAQAWKRAIEIGYERVEAQLLENFCRGGNDAAFAPDAPMPPMTVSEAIQLLHMHRQQVRGVGKAPGSTRRPRTLDDVRASIVRKLEMIERARLRQAERG